MIEENEMNNLIEQKRQELRDARNTTRPDSTNQNGRTVSQTKSNLVRDRTSANGETGSSVQFASGSYRQSEAGNRGTEGSDEGKRDPQRELEAEPKRVGPGRRRLGSVNPSSTDTQQEGGGSDRAANHGGIERIDGEFFRPDLAEKKEKEEKKANKLVSNLVKRLPDSSEDLPFLGSSKSKVFSKKEAEEQYEPLKRAISDYGYYLDLYMQKFEPDHPDTWGNFTDKELEVVARSWLKIAQKNQKAAAAARLAIDGQDYIGALVVLIPRVSITLQFVGRRLPRRQRRDNSKN
jgi:hypothetical protein